MNEDRELPGLGWIAAIIRWVEGLITLLSGPLLTIGLAIALIDLLTGGSLLRAVPELLFAWGVCQAVGIDSQLVSAWDKCRQAIRARNVGAIVGWLTLGCVLGYVGFLSAEAFGFQHAFGTSEADALQRLGIDPANWQLQRAALAVFLVALSGFTRPHTPKQDVTHAADEERAQLEADLMLEPLRQQKRVMQARGVRGVGAAFLGRETMDVSALSPDPMPAPATTQIAPLEASEQSDEPPNGKPPTGPGSPVKRPAVRKTRKRGANVVPLRKASVEERAAAAWQPGMSIPAFEKAAGISRPSAQKYAAKFSAQQAQAQHSEQAVQ